MGRRMRRDDDLDQVWSRSRRKRPKRSDELVKRLGLQRRDICSEKRGKNKLGLAREEYNF